MSAPCVIYTRQSSILVWVRYITFSPGKTMNDEVDRACVSFAGSLLKGMVIVIIFLGLIIWVSQTCSNPVL
jgi:hypothetical protein